MTVPRARSPATLTRSNHPVQPGAFRGPGCVVSLSVLGGRPYQSAGNPTVNFHGESRRNDTHQSTTDPDARLARKGHGREAKFSYAGHVLLDNRHGAVANVCTTPATGTAEREAAQLLLDARCAVSIGPNVRCHWQRSGQWHLGGSFDDASRVCGCTRHRAAARQRTVGIGARVGHNFRRAALRDWSEPRDRLRQPTAGWLDPTELPNSSRATPTYAPATSTSVLMAVRRIAYEAAWRPLIACGSPEFWRTTPAGAIPLEHTTARQREVVDLTGTQDAAMLAGEDLAAAAPATDASSAGAGRPRRRGVPRPVPSTPQAAARLATGPSPSAAPVRRPTLHA